MIVRTARVDELDRVSALIAAVFDEHLPGPDAEVSAPMRAAVATYRAELADVRSRLSNARLLVAEDELGGLVASVTLQLPGTVRPWPTGWASMRLLAVDPGCRGRGLGRALTTACIDLAREEGADAIGLHTSADWTAARALYRRTGFTRVPELDEWPAPEVHAEAYALALSERAIVAPESSPVRRGTHGRCP